MMMFHTAISGGVFLGPLINAYIVQYAGWRVRTYLFMPYPELQITGRVDISCYRLSRGSLLLEKPYC
jgi:hypothetical protein